MEWRKLFLSVSESQKLIAIIIFLIMTSLFLYQIMNFLQQDLAENVTVQPTFVNSKQIKITNNSIVFTKPLFGDYIPVINEADIKESTLDVELVGIMFSLNPEASQVIIKDTTGEERSYLVGDTLPGGAVVKRINENGVVVLYNGSLESLSLPKIELLFNKPAKPLISEE
ncbi:type II secretion system protein N [Legionella sp. CNM-1927-20]|uniref:type II secretion system protein N n=1 Tax=Legionella sp. CNM-1927-20 TaxID=3422221 RepID=UPI00403B0CF5